jgi:hypothetical protein
MAFLSSFYPQPVVAGTTAGTYAEGDDSRIVGALPSSTAGSGSVLAHSGSAGATARTLSSRFSEVVRVADFGAVGDGVTNDTAAIQNAINRAIALGSAVIEFEPKTYNLTTVSNNTIPNTMNVDNGYISKHHLQIVGGTTSLKLFFKGNGARLYTNISPNGSTIGQMIYMATDFDSVEFENITIERGPARITDSNHWPFQEMGFGAFPVSANSSKKLGFYNVNWINTTQFINGIWFYGGNSSKKLKQAIFDNCTWLYPYASNRTKIAASGSWGVSIYFDQWTDNLVFNNCYVDMASQGFVPNDCGYLRDGFNLGNGITTIWNNCTIKNCYIESCFSLGGQPDIQILTNTITWPEVGQTINVTLGNSPRHQGATFIAGQKLLLFKLSSTDRGKWMQGLFEFVSSSSTPYTTGTVLALKRLSSEEIPQAEFYTSQEPVVGSSYNLNESWNIINFDIQNQHCSHFNNCRFEGNNIRRQDGTLKARVILVESGGTGYTEPPTVSFSPSGGGLTATASILNGQVTEINISNPNYLDATTIGYFSEQPTITISGGNGAGAKAKMLFNANTPSPAIWSNNNTTITNCTFKDCSVGIYLKSGIARQGPNPICNNSFIMENVWNLDPEEYLWSSVGSIWHDYLKFSNNIILTKYPYPMDIISRYGDVSENLFVCYKPASGRKRRSAITIGNAINPCNLRLKNNNAIGFDEFVFAQNDNSYILDSYLGSKHLVPTLNKAVGFKEIIVDFRPTRNGWVRLNPLFADQFLNRGNSAVYKIGGLSFAVSATNADATATISVISTDRRLPITKIRVVKDGSVIWIETYVADWTFFNIQTAIKASVYSEDGSGLLSNPTSYSSITSIVSDGTDALVTSNNHGLLNGEVIFVSESNSTPSINGSRQVSSVTQNTFKISGITITGSGSSGEWSLNKRSTIKPINITSIVQNGTDVTITHDADSLLGENVDAFQSVYIYNSNSVPSLNGQRAITNPRTGRFDVAGITLSQAGTAHGTFIRLQDYSFNAAVVAQVDLNSESDLYAAKNISLGSSQLLTGTGAPSASSPNGSVYLRTDGDASTTLYVRANGTWEPMAAY